MYSFLSFSSSFLASFLYYFPLLYRPGSLDPWLLTPSLCVCLCLLLCLVRSPWAASSSPARCPQMPTQMKAAVTCWSSWTIQCPLRRSLEPRTPPRLCLDQFLTTWTVRAQKWFSRPSILMYERVEQYTVQLPVSYFRIALEWWENGILACQRSVKYVGVEDLILPWQLESVKPLMKSSHPAIKSCSVVLIFDVFHSIIAVYYNNILR